MHKHTIIAVLATAAVAAGCGGSSDNTLTKSEVIKQGTVICKAAEKRVENLPQLRVEHPFAKGVDPAVARRARQFLVGYADALNYSRVELLKLRAPSNDKQLLDGYLRDLGQVVDELRAASKARGAQAEDEANAAFGLFEKASSQTAKYGFPKGVCGAGES
jgi:protein involved in sex pheromone biosynthesis